MAGTEPVIKPPLGSDDGQAIREWLDALSSGRCSAETFLDEMEERSASDRETSWEVLALLDQYYRRGKIPLPVFRQIKSQLEGSALGTNEVAKSEPGASPSRVTSPAWNEIVPQSRNDARTTTGDVTVGDLLRNRYRLLEVRGRGGMGIVFEALDEYRLDLPESDQRVALKVLHTAVSARKELLADLQREFQHLQLLSHPNIVRVHEFDRDGDTAFFTMELLSGVLLSRILTARQGVPLPLRYALALIREVGAALSHAHSRGVIHGDVSPKNIMITHDGQVRVLDFGASHRAPTADADGTAHVSVATLGYASCQLLEGRRPEASDDLFAFACVAYVALSGQHPFPKLTALQARSRRVHPARPPRLPSRQWRVLREGLHWESSQRPPDLDIWLKRLDLRRAASRMPPVPSLLDTAGYHRSRATSAAAALTAMGLLFGGGYWAWANGFFPVNDMLSRAGTFLANLTAPSSAPRAPVFPPLPAPAVQPKTSEVTAHPATAARPTRAASTSAAAAPAVPA